ncbi:Methylthioribulose-1-phosphate dehydratase [Halotydeus destructor]|nr:Methylthioribulose-1-phosphate dehydratase [Halotydeus destructor]
MAAADGDSVEHLPIALAQDDPRRLIPELCSQFYTLGWVSGTGGGMSIRRDEDIFIAPSGVQKERIEQDDMYVMDIKGNVIREPSPEKKLKRSDCTPLFMNAYRLRDAGAVIHSHAISAALATMVSDGNEFRISFQEMIKGIKKGSTTENHRYDDTLIVPIIENTAFECDLTDRMAQAMEQYPDTNAVLVRRHGVYIWGKTWQAAKTMAECYHYLFEMAVQLKQLGISATARPEGYAP